MSNQSAPGNQPDPNPVEQFRRVAEPLRQFLNDWVPVFTPIVASIALLLGAVGLPSTITTQIAWIVLIAAALVATYFLWRWQKSRSRVPRQEPAPDLSGLRARTAFRGLAGFQIGDQLPGEQRRREARTIFTHISDDNFRFGILSGDTGAGKSSLARTELTKILEAEGYKVILLASPRQVFSRSGADAAAKAVRDRGIQAIRDWVAPRLGSKPGYDVLLIDQFEEFFIQFKKIQERHGIARLLRLLIDELDVRILCIIRRDYYLDFHDFAQEIAEPTSARNTFNLKNFEVAEATNVIIECAGFDQIAISESVAREIANDLADKGEVRPAELQIVCTALRGNFEIESYRLRGGAAIILSHHVTQAIESSGDPRVARLILRALCDFPGNAKSQPYDTKQLATLVSRTERPNDELVEAVVLRILNHLLGERLVSRSLRDGVHENWSLIHDYLVEPIKIATQDASTRIEDATRALETFIKEWRSNRRTVIPLGRLREIQRYALTELLNTKDARRLVLRSNILGYGRPTAMIAGAVVLTVGAVALASYESVWVPTASTAERVNASGSQVARRLAGGRVVLTSGDAFRGGSKEAYFWNAETGDKLNTFSGERVFSSEAFLVDLSQTDKTLRVVNLDNIKTLDDAKNLVVRTFSVNLPEKPGESSESVNLDGPVFLLNRSRNVANTLECFNYIIFIDGIDRVVEPRVIKSCNFNVVYNTIDSKSYLISAHENEDNTWELVAISSDGTVLHSKSGYEITGYVASEDKTRVFVVSQNGNDEKVCQYVITNNGLVSERSRSFSEDGPKSRGTPWVSGGLLAIANDFLEDVHAVVRSSDLALLDTDSKDKRSGRAVAPDGTGFPYIEGTSGEVRVWNPADLTPAYLINRLRIGSLSR